MAAQAKVFRIIQSISKLYSVTILNLKVHERHYQNQIQKFRLEIFPFQMKVIANESMDAAFSGLCVTV